MEDDRFGQQLILLGTLLSFEIASGRSTEEVELLSALLQVIGDNLALIATVRAGQPASGPGTRQSAAQPEQEEGEPVH